MKAAIRQLMPYARLILVFVVVFTSSFLDWPQLLHISSSMRTVTASSAWYGSSWLYRKKIAINASQVSGTSTLANFPLLINSSDPDWKYTSFGGKFASATASEIVFTAADGTTKLDDEIETYASSTGALTAWLRIPSLSPTTTNELYIYYGNASAGDQQNVHGV
jgi:hypothetical protein